MSLRIRGFQSLATGLHGRLIYCPTRRLLHKRFQSAQTSNQDNKLEKLAQKLRQTKENSFYSEKPFQTNTESEIVRNFTRLVKENDTIEPDFSDWIKLHEPQTETKLPPLPERLTGTTLIKFIDKIDTVKTRKYPRNREFVSECYNSVLDSGLLKNVESYNKILKFYSLTHDFDAIKKTMKKMREIGTRPTTESFNCLMNSMIFSRNSFREQLIAMYLRQMELFKLKPNFTTCYIVFTALKHEKSAVFDLMIEHNCPLEPIIDQVLLYRYRDQKQSPAELHQFIAEKDIKIDSGLLPILVQIELEHSGPEAAWKQVSEWLQKDFALRPPARVLILFVTYFCNHQQLYNAIAITGLFYNHLGLNTVHRSHGIMLESMVNSPSLVNWPVLVKRFYRDASMGVGGVAVLPRVLNRLSEVAKSRCGPEFDISRLSKAEDEEISAVFEALSWQDWTDPKFGLGENSESFISAADYVRTTSE